MKIEISNFKVLLKDKDKSLKDLICKKYGLFEKYIYGLVVIKQSIDARDKTNIFLVYNLLLQIDNKAVPVIINKKFVKEYTKPDISMEYPNWNQTYRPIIVGFGPSSMFAALYLARCNAKPIIIERGSAVDKRIKDVYNFINNKELNESSNIQFGEGGAGTFSDGKLTTNLNDPLISYILNEFVIHGAPNEILYESMPHIGTDYLTKIVKNIREEIINYGGEFYFNHKFEDFTVDNDIIEINVKGEKELTFKTKHLLLGFGHSARDTIKMLYKHGINMEAKSFSMGVRVEHTRDMINSIQYGKYADSLSPAYYKLSCHLANGRSVYTFCMCPGGTLMASQSEKNTIITNGMSTRARDNNNSNSGLLVSVDPDDFVKKSILDGLDYQEYYEKKAFDISKDYRAPANLMREFLKNDIASKERSVKTSYPHGIIMADFYECLPDYVVNSLREALPLFNRKMKGFTNDDAILVGIESRSSCPIRVLRNDNREANFKGIYPIGEGAGYAGGITSAALDGLKTAISILKEK